MQLRILFLSHKFYPEIGGIEVNSEILVTAFHRAGHHVKLITWTEDPTNKQFPFPVIRKPSIFTLLKEHNWAEIIYENNPCLRLSWPSVLFNKTSVVALRTWVLKSNGELGWQNKLKMMWLLQVSAVIAVSNAIKDRCWPAATVIGNPYREHIFKVLPNSIRSRDFVFLGRLVSDKGADHAIKALAALLSLKKDNAFLYPDLSLTIIGDGSDRQALEALAQELNVAHRIKFTGALSGDELVSCLNLHRFLLVPSLWEEPFGNVALEGMACGCVPIVSDGGGLPDAVGEAGLTFKRGSLDEFVKTIQRALSEPYLERRLRSYAASHLEDHLPDTVSRKYLNVIEKAYRSNK